MYSTTYYFLNPLDIYQLIYIVNTLINTKNYLATSLRTVYLHH